MSDENKRISLHKKLKSYLVEVDQHSTVPLDIDTAKVISEEAEKIFKKLEVVQETLEATATDAAAVDVQFQVGLKWDKTYRELRSKLRKIIDQLTVSKTPATATSSTSGTVKLPTISLPHFDGCFDQWVSFHDLFTSAVANNLQLSGSQKLQYLKSSLRGEPLQLIDYLTTTDTNYKEAWTILEERYNNSREIRRTHVVNFLDYKPLKIESAKELQALLDNSEKCLRSLKLLGCKTEEWDDLTVVIMEKKLDCVTRREWARRLTGTTPPTFKELSTFLVSHIRGLQAAGASSSTPAGSRGEKQLRVNYAVTDSGNCPNCNQSHQLQACQDFLASSASDRSAIVRKARLCFNCLKPDHILKACSSPRRCKKCGSKHHTLLHEERKVAATSTAPSTSKEVVPTVQGHHIAADDGGLLMTAVVQVPDRYGQMQRCRVFIDGGSEGEFVSAACKKRLGLTRQSSKVKVKGIGDSKAGTSTGKVTTTLFSRHNGLGLEVELLVMSKITGKLPSVKKKSNYAHLQGIPLADSEWFIISEIDILIGIKYYDEVVLNARRRGEKGAPVAYETIFGWGVAGVCPPEEIASIRSHHITLVPIQEQLQKFWVMEEPPKKRILTKDEVFCENHFKQTYQRDETGRFVVRVPFDKEKLKTLGKSRDIAFRRLQQVERRLAKNPQLSAQYREFMKEYEDLGHMSKLHSSARGEEIGKTNYLCHHFVVNDSSTTTKLRVVFDGSAATTTQVSLNDTMLIGATLQDDIFDLLLRFRIHQVVIIADIVKMFRGFGLHEDDAKFHRILWRSSPDQPVEEFQLNTVTYGTGYAPNVATRCLQQLGSDCAEEYPMASKVLLNDAFVDDILSGQPTPEEAIQLYKQIVAAVKTAGLELRKWTSNSQQVLNEIPAEIRETSEQVLGEKDLVKALGVQWCPATDKFQFKKIVFEEAESTTKRSLLSELARVFDPLGFISCVTLRGKLLMQELWKSTTSWDENVPASIHNMWKEYNEDLKHLPEVSILRCILPAGGTKVELHGFCDASELAFGGICYLRTIFSDGSVKVNFVTSKTRVAPMRQVTLPRLELCAAVLLAELMVHVKEVLKLEVETFCWSDSTITLTWIAASPRRWKTFVANRVAAIQELTVPSSWRHVAGVENPADLASRGSTAKELINSSLWWNGPDWLSCASLPAFPKEPTEGDLEERGLVAAVMRTEIAESPILLRYSSLQRLKRVTAWHFRWLLFKIRKTVKQAPLSAVELQGAFSFWIRTVQRQHFEDEYQLLLKKKEVGSKSKLKSLHPYIDNYGIIRVSGRLENVSWEVERKNQAIVPGSSHLSELIVDHYHKSSLHSGFQSTWSAIQQEFWIIRGRDRVRHLVRSRVKCRRYRAKIAEQLMGSLPAPRVTPSRPFTHTGVDYAGPFILKDVVGRVPKTYKGYMCVFVCLATKAVYLEAASSLSTEAFIAALRRFVSRRGLPSHMYSDCGTNFVGADRELKTFVEGAAANKAITDELGAKGIQWHFNPPGAPHFGGLWEAAVKSAKYHLRRVTGISPMTYEQFATLLSQVEAVLNSRPLSPRSAEPGDVEPLTPGHFLIGAPLTTVPDPALTEIPRNRLSQYQGIQQQLQLFWKRWSREYLNTLQQRTKWMWESANVKVGDLVLLVEEAPPATWKMGRIQAVHPGIDGKVREVSVKTATAVVNRVIAKLVPLLAESDDKFTTRADVNVQN